MCITEWGKYHLLFMNKHILMYMSTFMHFLFCLTCVLWDYIITDIFMNDTVSLKTMTKLFAFEPTCVTKYLDVHSGLKTWHSESICSYFWSQPNSVSVITTPRLWHCRSVQVPLCDAVFSRTRKLENKHGCACVVRVNLSLWSTEVGRLSDSGLQSRHMM